MEPAEALRRIAFLLESKGAETYKVRAFRNAAATVDSVDAATLARLHEANRLEDLDGVGKSTAQVIAEALSGSEPAYLADLEGEGGVEAGSAAAGASCWPRSAATATATRTGPTAGARSTRWRGRPPRSAATTRP